MQHAREVRFGIDHPTRAGHFPGNPIIPGAVLLDEVLRTIVTTMTNGTIGQVMVRSAKFLEPVRPGDAVLIRWEARDTGETKFELLLREPERRAVIGVVELGAGAR